MSSEWRPDDKHIDDRNNTVDKIEEALKKHGLNRENILTSRDPGMDEARHDLRREHMPPGWRTWQLPTYLTDRPTFFFLSTNEPGAVLPAHSHKTDQLRVILSGRQNFNGVELKSGDWIWIPKGKEYSVSGSFNLDWASILYCY